MKTLEDIALVQSFSEIEDTRDPRGRRHNLYVAIIMAVCAVLCGANSFEGIADFSECKLDWFKKFFDLPHGSPSADTFTRIFALIKPEVFERCFLKWIQNIKEVWDGETIAIDGKTLRRSYDEKNGLGALHLVNAYAVKSGLVLLQKEVDKKTNEITVIPDLLESLILKNTVVTIDAMGCQKNIAEMICDNGGDYLLSLKGNQGLFHKNVVQFLDQVVSMQVDRKFDYCETLDPASHGREEIRKCFSIEITKEDVSKKLFDNISEWKNLNSVAMIEAARIKKNTGETSIERRFYISSLKCDAKEILERSREHWGVENSLHYVLDVTYQEDASRVRKTNATQNFSLIKKTSLNLIKSFPYKQKKISSIAGVRRIAGWSNEFMEELLFTN